MIMHYFFGMMHLAIQVDDFTLCGNESFKKNVITELKKDIQRSNSSK